MKRYGQARGTGGGLSNKSRYGRLLEPVPEAIARDGGSNNGYLRWRRCNTCQLGGKPASEQKVLDREAWSNTVEYFTVGGFCDNTSPVRGSHEAYRQKIPIALPLIP